MRKTDEQLKELKKKHSIKILWSWSKISTFITSTYEYFLHYILHKAPDREESVYSTAGSCCHNILERFYGGLIKYEKMIEEFEYEWAKCDVFDLKFDRSNPEKNASIKKKYVYNLEHFFKTHKVIPYKTYLEKFILIKLSAKVILIGYMDCVFKCDEGYAHIIDFKTSTIYSGAKIKENSQQLILYALGMSQAGIPLQKIKIAWNFLKYQAVTIKQKNGEKKIRNIERIKLGESIKTNATMWLKHLGYSTDEIDGYIELLIQTNNIKVLPEDIQKLYEFDDCYVYIDLNEEIIEDLKANLLGVVDDIENRTEQYRKTNIDKMFWDSEESLKKESYYLANLMPYSAKIHKPYGQHLDKYNAEKNFGFTVSGVINANNQTKQEECNNNLDWLDDLI